jgi:hypothetical protein
MAQPHGTIETLTGTAASVNERGVRIAGTWYNLSKFHPVALPMRGALVALEVQGGRWIQRCDVLDGQDAHSEPTRPTAPSSARDAMILPGTSRSRPRWPTARRGRPPRLPTCCPWPRASRRG